MEATEYLNRVEIRGKVGHDPRINNVGDSQVARFSVATSESYRARNGELREEVTWHNVTVWSGPRVAPFDNIKKGTFVHLKGRLRNTRYTDSTGAERHIVEIVALELEVVY